MFQKGPCRVYELKVKQPRRTNRGLGHKDGPSGFQNYAVNDEFRVSVCGCEIKCIVRVSVNKKIQSDVEIDREQDQESATHFSGSKITFQRVSYLK